MRFILIATMVAGRIGLAGLCDRLVHAGITSITCKWQGVVAKGLLAPLLMLCTHGLPVQL